MGHWELLKMLLSLVLVFGLMGLLLWALRRMQGKLQTAAGAHRQMQVIETLGMGPRQKVVLMQVDGQRVLVGISAQSMQTLGQWPAPSAQHNVFSDALSDARQESPPHV
jgi:flagellar protein FliO/FliZ